LIDWCLTPTLEE